MVVNRHVDRVGEFLPRTIHNHVPIREGTSLTSLPW